MDESYTFKKYLLGLVENTENHDIFYFKPGTIFINCYFPGNFIIEINKEYPMGGATKFIASLIDAKFRTTFLLVSLMKMNIIRFTRQQEIIKLNEENRLKIT